MLYLLSIYKQEVEEFKKKENQKYKIKHLTI
jgi:hypothetical protein